MTDLKIETDQVMIVTIETDQAKGIEIDITETKTIGLTTGKVETITSGIEIMTYQEIMIELDPVEVLTKYMS